jgi:hypothetical protein
VNDTAREFLAVMTALWPPRPKGRMPLADWLACMDINETWAAVRAGTIPLEATTL